MTQSKNSPINSPTDSSIGAESPEPVQIAPLRDSSASDTTTYQPHAPDRSTTDLSGRGVHDGKIQETMAVKADAGAPTWPAPIEFTTFAGVRQTAGTRHVMAWPDFIGWLRAAPVVATKDDSPVLKLALFNGPRSDAAIVEVTGVEIDYDAEAVTIGDAAEQIERHGIRAVLYTSYSNAAGKPRWRVLCPLAQRLPPGRRAQMVARVNGALWGIIAPESFTLSQPYFYGHAPGADYKVIAIEGEDCRCIDEIGELDEIARGSKKPVPVDAGGAPPAEKQGVEDWLADLLDGDNVHGNALRVVGRMVARGLDDETIHAVFHALFDAIAKARGFERANALCYGGELDRMIAGARAKGFEPIDPKEAMAKIAARIDSSCDDEVQPILEHIANTRLSESQRDILFRRIKKKHHVTLSALRADETNLRAAAARTARGGGTDPEKKDQLAHAEDLIEELGGDANVLYTLDAFWRWDAAGVWRRAHDREIKQVAQKVLDSGDVDVSKTLVDGVVDVAKSSLFERAAQLDARNWRLVNVQNGTLEWVGSGWQLREHRREDFLTTQIPVAFDADAIAPRFEEFLREVFAGDADADQKALCVLELIGYTLLTTCRYERFVLLIGGGANGKSVLLGVIEALLGPGGVAAVQPSQFDNRFQRAHLHGKLANIVTEIAQGAEILDAQLKAIVSGELTTAEHKNRDPFEFRPFATCWFGTNHMPHTRDFTEALFRRATVLWFNNTFKDGARDPHLKDRLSAELPGILALALGAIAGVLQRNAFTVPASSTEAAREWRRDVDQVAQFVEECCYASPGTGIASAELYMAYDTWADEAGVKHHLSRKSFTDRIVRLGAKAGKAGKSGTRTIFGFALRNRGNGEAWQQAA
jgi:putative DNA primase/helicase